MQQIPRVSKRAGMIFSSDAHCIRHQRNNTNSKVGFGSLVSFYSSHSVKASSSRFYTENHIKIIAFPELYQNPASPKLETQRMDMTATAGSYTGIRKQGCRQLYPYSILPFSLTWFTFTFYEKVKRPIQRHANFYYAFTFYHICGCTSMPVGSLDLPRYQISPISYVCLYVVQLYVDARYVFNAIIA